MTREGIYVDSKFAIIAGLPEVAAPRPHHFASVLDRSMKADRCLTREGTPQTLDLSFQGQPSLHPNHFDDTK